MRLWGITIRGFSAGGCTALDGDPSRGYYDGIAGGITTAMGILCYPNASPTIVNCVIDDCHSRGDNGGNGAAAQVPAPHPIPTAATAAGQAAPGAADYSVLITAILQL